MRASASSRDRLLAAAGREFAARGYAGASVDRIATAARLNKAMIYYHFTSKAGLYRTIVREVFGAVLESVSDIAGSEAVPAEKIRRFVGTIAEVLRTHPHFPSIWLAEFSSGAAHMDQQTLGLAARVVQTLGRILSEGQTKGVFRPASPILVHIGIVAPILLYLVSGAGRERLAKAQVPGARDITLDQMVGHVTQSTLGSLCIGNREKHA